MKLEIIYANVIISVQFVKTTFVEIEICMNL